MKFLTFSATLIISTYFIVGMIIKKFVYKASGIDLIPNIGFWRTIFGWIKTIVTCGRSGGFAQLVDEDEVKGYGSDVNDSNTTSEKPVSGYGTV